MHATAVHAMTVGFMTTPTDRCVAAALNGSPHQQRKTRTGPSRSILLPAVNVWLRWWEDSNGGVHRLNRGDMVSAIPVSVAR